LALLSAQFAQHIAKQSALLDGVVKRFVAYAASRRTSGAAFFASSSRGNRHFISAIANVFMSSAEWENGFLREAN